MKDSSVRVSIFRRVGEEDPRAGDYGLQRVGEDEKLFTKPTLLCCGGGGTLKGDDEVTSTKLANGFIKLGHALLSFVALPAPLDLLKCPKALHYPKAKMTVVDDDSGAEKTVDHDFTKIAHVADYDRRIAKACRASKVAER